MSYDVQSVRLAVLTAAVLTFAPLLAAGQERQEAHGAAAVERRLHPKTPEDLKQLLKYTGEPLPLVSGHRGGAAVGFPENCIPTFENTLRHTYALLEIDPRYAKEGHIVVHHDPRLERTTNGKGLLTDHTLAELKQLRLKDLAGNVTEFRMPTLDEVLQWARGKAVLVLDQKDVPAAVRAKKVEEHKAESYAMLIVYSFKDAQACYAQNPNIMMEVMIPSHEKIAEFDKLGVPWRNVIAFVGHVPPEDPTLYAEIHRRGALCLVGTSRNLDREVLSGRAKSITDLEPQYKALLARGADLFETDIPAPLGAMLYSTSAPPPAKQTFFSKP